MRTKRGLASLPLVVGLIGFLLVAAGFRLFGTGQALHQAARDAGGLVAESLATSAIEEALWTFQEQVNDPASPLFEPVRRALLVGDEPELDLSDRLAPTRLPELLQTSPHRGAYRRVTLEPLVATLRIPVRAAAAADLPAERVVPAGEQVLDLACTAHLEIQGHRIHRRVLVRRRYGMTFVSPFKPFDQLTFAIVESDFLAGYRTLVDGLAGALHQMQYAHRTLRQLSLDLGEGSGRGPGRELRVYLPTPFLTLGEAPPMPTAVAARLRDLLLDRPDADPVAHALRTRPWSEVGWLAWSLVPSPIDRVLPGRVPEPAPVLAMPAPPPSGLVRDLPAPDSVIFSSAARVELADFDYERKVDDSVTPILVALEEAAVRWNALLARLVDDPGAHLAPADLRDLEGRAAALAALGSGPLREAVTALNRISAHVQRHTRLGFNRDALRAYLSTSSRRLRSLAFHAEAPGDLEALRASLPAVNGHVAYYGTEPLALDVRGWKGQTVLSAPWSEEPVPVSLASFTVADRTRDRAVLHFDRIDFGSGTIEAGVYVNREAHFDGSPSIFGNLVLARRAARSERTSRGDLRGTVVRDPRLGSGGYWKRAPDDGPWRGPLPDSVSLGHYTIGLAPRGQRKAIERAPGLASTAEEDEP